MSSEQNQVARSDFTEPGYSDSVKDFDRLYDFNSSVHDYLRLRSFRIKKTPLFNDLENEYIALWSETAIQKNKLKSIDSIIADIQKNRDKYEALESSLGIPWYFIAAVHNLESTRSFNKHLHNGDPLSAKTVNEPKGHPKNGTPPFTWEESAEDALKLKGLHKISDWPISRICYEMEHFNGWGYRLYHPEVKSPYLWSFSNHYSKGKYVADNKWSSSAVSSQCGGITLLKRMQDEGIIHIETNQRDQSLAYNKRQENRKFEHEWSSNRVGEDRLSAILFSDVESLPSGMAQGSEEEGLIRADELTILPYVGRHLRTSSSLPKPLPTNKPVQFAGDGLDITNWIWPISTNHPNAKVVSYETIEGKIIGRSGRCFLARRSGGNRYHVGVDLFCYHKDIVVAMSDGKVVNFYPFYETNAGELSYCLFVEHDGLVVNYAEVKESAPSEFGWKIGDKIQLGDEIARVSTTRMLHLETYISGTAENKRWMVDEKQPKELLNPTDLLLALSIRGNQPPSMACSPEKSVI